VANSKIYLRYGIVELMQVIKEANLQMYVVSAGILGTVSESFYILQKQIPLDLTRNLVYCMTPELYDKDSCINGFAEPTIITTNKHLFVSHKICPNVHEGDNAIVLGDMIEDYQIIKSLKLTNVLGIGFFNTHEGFVPEHITKYMDVFDIVIACDGNLIHVAELVKLVAGLPPSPNYADFGPTTLALA
jgi:hypothetical protein